MGAAKEPIRLRKRTTPTGNVSLYLDIYLNGKRSYEYLKMYLVPEKTKADKRRTGRLCSWPKPSKRNGLSNYRTANLGSMQRTNSKPIFSIITGQCAKNDTGAQTATGIGEIGIAA